MSISLNIYDSSNKNKALNSSLLGIGNGFLIRLYEENSFYKYNSDYWRIPVVKSFAGIMLENLALNFQTSWSDAGGAVLGKSIASKINSKFIKILAGQSEAGFKPFLCSDAWTQQKVSGEAQPIKAQIKFKAYNLDRMGCTNYNDILRFLIHICSPVKSASAKNNPVSRGGLGDDIASTLNDAVAGGSQIIGTIIETGKTFMNGDKASLGTIAKTFVETMDSSYNKITAETGNGKNNANFTVQFALGDITGAHKDAGKIHNRNIYVDSINPNTNITETKEYCIDWIVTGFTFKPSTQFQMVKENGMSVPKPLWMDFDLSLETRLSLSNRYVYDVLMPKTVNIKTGL